MHRAVVAAQPRDGVDAGHGVVENNAGDDDVGLGREGQGRLYIETAIAAKPEWWRYSAYISNPLSRTVERVGRPASGGAWFSDVSTHQMTTAVDRSGSGREFHPVVDGRAPTPSSRKMTFTRESLTFRPRRYSIAECLELVHEEVHA